MSKLYLYTVFHANLNYSYIPHDLYPQVLRDCYWPLLRTVERLDVPLGLEMSAHTLQMVNSMDASFTRKLGSLWHDGLCEVIGCGYVQSVMPLIPARVNRENLRHGNEVYRELLGRTPTTAYVNELVYSSSLPRLYREAGFEAMVANWESTPACQTDPELLYHPCAVPAGDGGPMPVIWHSQAASREFQDYVQGRNHLESYLDQLLAHAPHTEDRAFPLYSSDWDVFDFHPWHPQPDGFEAPESGEMDRIASLLALLKDREDVKLVTPGSLSKKFPQPPVVSIDSSAYPLPYKKQDLHSPARWAVGGRDNVRLNTQCHQLYQGLLLAEWLLDRHPATADPAGEMEALWRELCFLWNSDFRTFTTEDKFVDFRNRMGGALERIKRLTEEAMPPHAASQELWLANLSSVPAESEPVSFEFPIDGAVDHMNGYSLRIAGEIMPSQVTQRMEMGGGATKLTVEALPRLAPAQAESATIRRRVATPGGANNPRLDREQSIIETESVRLRLLPGSGGAIQSLTFPPVSAEPLIGKGFLETSPGTGSVEGELSGDLFLEDWLGRSIEDHRPTALQYADPAEDQSIFVPVRCSIKTEIGTIWKTYRVYRQQPRVDLTYRFQWRDLVPKFFRLGRMALNPLAFDRRSLYYATTNGGDDIERFLLAGTEVLHDEAPGGEVTSRCCLGATDGWVVLGDAEKGIAFITRPAGLYSAPLVHYREPTSEPDHFAFALIHSLGEMDETSHTLWRGHSTWSLSILAGKEDIIDTARASAALANGGLVVRSRASSRLD